MGPEYPKIETLFVRDNDFKVDSTRIKNPTYRLISEWDWTEKIDGTNIRIHWDNVEKRILVGGRTNAASIPGDLTQWIYNNVNTSLLVDHFPDVAVTLYGEGYGAGIQKGGGYSKEKRFILFDVLVGEKFWLNQENINDVAANLRLDVVPSLGRMSIQAAVDLVRWGFSSALGDNPKAEGIVGRPPYTLYDSNSNRLIIKLKTNDFRLRKENFYAQR